MNSRLSDFLSFGSLGHSHLLVAAQKAFRSAENAASPAEANASIETGARLLCMSWVESPLNGRLAGEIHRLSSQVPALRQMLGEDGAGFAAEVASTAAVHEDRAARLLFFGGEYDALNDHVHALAAGGNTMAAAGQAWLYQRTLSQWDWLEDFIGSRMGTECHAIRELLMAEVFLANGKYGQAVDAYERLHGTLSIPGIRFRLATALAGAGDLDRSRKLLKESVAEFPMHTSALLLLDSLAFPAKRGFRLDGKCIVSIYSYNKSKELSQTLESVLASDLGSAVGDITVRVLINGSEDDSLDVALAAQERFGARMDVVPLPVNVGAPAARNWLIDAAAKDGAEWLVFLDDDVLVPSDWLAGLASGVKEYPDAGVWGCRVGDGTSDSITQHADGFLLSPEDAQATGQNIALHAPAGECMLPLQLGYRRHSATVTGCCHLFRVETLVDNHGFDLRFSPSQYDDFDSDLRLLKQGRGVVYLGDVGIKHLRVSPRLSEPSESAQLQSENHFALLEGCHKADMDRLYRTQTAFVRGDLKSKRARLQAAGYLPASS